MISETFPSALSNLQNMTCYGRIIPIFINPLILKKWTSTH